MCTIQPLVSIGVNGILKSWTSFNLWYLDSHNHRCCSLPEDLHLKSLSDYENHVKSPGWDVIG